MSTQETTCFSFWHVDVCSLDLRTNYLISDKWSQPFNVNRKYILKVLLFSVFFKVSSLEDAFGQRSNTFQLKKEEGRHAELFCSLHKRLFVLLCRAGGRMSHIQMKIERKIKIEAQSHTQTEVHHAVKSQDADEICVPSWSSWHAPLPSGSPCRVCSSGRPAGVLFASWRGRLCPPLGLCSECCCRCEWSRRWPRMTDWFIYLFLKFFVLHMAFC